MFLFGIWIFTLRSRNYLYLCGFTIMNAGVVMDDVFSMFVHVREQKKNYSDLQKYRICIGHGFRT